MMVAEKRLGRTGGKGREGGVVKVEGVFLCVSSGKSYGEIHRAPCCGSESRLGLSQGFSFADVDNRYVSVAVAGERGFPLLEKTTPVIMAHDRHIQARFEDFFVQRIYQAPKVVWDIRSGWVRKMDGFNATDFGAHTH
jgi:hypothetical protein